MVQHTNHVSKIRDWSQKHGYEFEYKGKLDGGDTVFGVLKTKRGARYHVRASSQRDIVGSTVVARSSSSIPKADPNSIKILINNQVVKGKRIGYYNLKE